MREYRDRQRSRGAARPTPHRLGRGAVPAGRPGRRQPIRAWEERVEGRAPRPLPLGDAWSDRHGLHHLRSLDPVEAPRRRAGGAAARPRRRGAGAARGADGATPDDLRLEPQAPSAGAPSAPRPVTVEAEAVARHLFGQPVREPRLALAELAWVEPEVRALRARLEADARHDGGGGRRRHPGPRPLRGGPPRPRAAAAPHRDPPRRRARRPRALGRRHLGGVLRPRGRPAAARRGGPRQRRGGACGVIDEGLAALRGRWPKRGRVLATGHAHIDYAWLWPRGETVRKIHRTFASQDQLLDRTTRG